MRLPNPESIGLKLPGEALGISEPLPLPFLRFIRVGIRRDASTKLTERRVDHFTGTSFLKPGMPVLMCSMIVCGLRFTVSPFFWSILVAIHWTPLGITSDFASSPKNAPFSGCEDRTQVIRMVS